MCRIILLLTLLLLSSGRHSLRNFSFGVSKLPTSTLMYFCVSTSTSFTIKNTFCPEVVLEYSPLFGTLIEQRLHGLHFQKVKVFPLQQTEIFKAGWFSLWRGISAARNETTTFSLKFADRVVYRFAYLESCLSLPI